MATQDQKDQLISLIATRLKPNILDKDRLQSFLGDPEALYRFSTEFIATYERRVHLSVNLNNLPQPEFPKWTRMLVLEGNIRHPENIEFTAIMSSFWLDPRQTGNEKRPSGHELLAALVSEDDVIHGTFGLAELTYMQDDWVSLPASFKTWAQNKLLYGWRDVVRSDEGHLFVPYLNCSHTVPSVCWRDLSGTLSGEEPALRW
jgi:hypothetical protein